MNKINNNFIFESHQNLHKKLQDRLFTLKNINEAPHNIQYFIAKETLDIFVPLAHKHGFYALKKQLEQISLKYTDPVAYAYIEQRLKRNHSIMEVKLDDMIWVIKNTMKKNGLSTTISGRIKSYYSIYLKMKKQNIPFSKIQDIFAIRIIVNSISECYNALSGLRHQWNHLHESYRDYILNPKPNGYQSIHLKLKLKNHILEVQIRTWGMHQRAEKGNASHFKYKESFNISNTIKNNSVQPFFETKENIRQMIKGKGIILQSAKGLVLKPAHINIKKNENRIYLVKSSGRQIKNIAQITNKILRTKNINKILGLKT